MPRAGFDVAGVRLLAAAQSATGLAPIAEMLAPFARVEPRPGSWRILVLDRPALPFDRRLEPPREGALPEGIALRSAWSPAGRQYLVDGRLGLRIDYRRRLAICRLGGAADLLLTTAGLVVLDAILEQEHQHMLHAGLLALPEDLGGGGLLLLGDSGAGKSSTTLALARAGFALGGDDAAVLRLGREGAVEAWGFPRELKVHPITAGLLPWLRAVVPAEARDEVPVTQAEAGRLVATLPTARPLALRAVAFLGPRGPAHRAEVLSAAETALRLTAGQLFAPERRLNAAVAEQFSLLAAIGRQCRWRLALSLGPDLAGLPDWLRAQLA